MKYPIYIHEENGCYGVTVPDLPGCFSAGDSVEDAIESVKEAIDLHAEGMVEEGMLLPQPQAISHHKNKPDYADGIWALVDVDMTRYMGKSQKINITLPATLIGHIDDYVGKQQGASRSGFLADAALARLGLTETTRYEKLFMAKKSDGTVVATKAKSIQDAINQGYESASPVK